jgi:hypothetical protein
MASGCEVPTRPLHLPNFSTRVATLETLIAEAVKSPSENSAMDKPSLANAARNCPEPNLARVLCLCKWNWPLLHQWVPTLGLAKESWKTMAVLESLSKAAGHWESQIPPSLVAVATMTWKRHATLCLEVRHKS